MPHRSSLKSTARHAKYNSFTGILRARNPQGLRLEGEHEGEHKASIHSLKRGASCLAELQALETESGGGVTGKHGWSCHCAG